MINLELFPPSRKKHLDLLNPSVFSPAASRARRIQEANALDRVLALREHESEIPVNAYLRELNRISRDLEIKL